MQPFSTSIVSVAGRLAVSGLLLLFVGCQLAVDDADREVYRLIEKRQMAALGKTQDTRIDKERWPDWKKAPVAGADSPYKFAPHPVDSEVPASFNTVASQPAGGFSADVSSTVLASQPAATTQPTANLAGDFGSAATRPTNIFGAVTPPVMSAETRPAAAPAAVAIGPLTTAPAATQPDGEPAQILSLADSLRYAFGHARELQNAKEDLYLAALALSLERHLWTPQLVGEISSQYANYGEIRDFDHAMDMVSSVAVQQKLPYGGEVTARVLGTLMRDLTRHLTTGETGSMVLEARIPLLRGAGPAAFESRFQAERDLIYAVRAFERFRRTLAVDIAGEYFNLQQLRQAIVNEEESIKSFTSEAERARALWQTGRILQLEVQRADQDRLVAISRKIDAVEAYQSALADFKIRIGMPMEQRIDVLPLSDPSAGENEGTLETASLEEALKMPAVSDEEAVRVGLKYRLDLLNDLDRIDDTRRGVDIAENSLLPDLTAHGTVTINTDPTEFGMYNWKTDRTTTRGQLTLELPLDRYKERNDLRTALITKRKAERTYQRSRDLVELQIRRAIRRVKQQQEALQIQMINRDVALQRREGARIRFNQGKVSNREVVDAENFLLDARNSLARAQSQVWLAILQFRRDTETLRIDDQGHWPTNPPRIQVEVGAAGAGQRGS